MRTTRFFERLMVLNMFMLTLWMLIKLVQT